MVKDRGWARRYPPLTAVVVALALAVFALPSALNLPQANPGQTLEYAPVPGNGNSNAQGGNFAGLGLGAGGSAGPSDLGLGNPLALQNLLNSGRNPSSKRCVGTPLRQTEDPIAPPCVAFFNGGNGGSTYTGVNATSVTVLFYADHDFVYSNCSTDNNNPPPNKYYDLRQPADPSENTCVTDDLRAWEKYFNDRFQTYNRVVHFWVYFAGATQNASPSERRADAADNIARLHPFAVVMPPAIFGGDGYLNAYQQAMNDSGVVVFASQQYQPSSFYQRYPALLWGYAASAEEQARSFASFVCQKAKPYGVSFSGPTFPTGRQRSYGFIETTDSSKPLMQQYQRLARSYIEQCGISFVDTADYPIDGYISYVGPQQSQYQGYAAPQMARFSQKQITTLIWPAGFENQFSAAAAQLAYFPEWITGGGDGISDGFSSPATQDKNEWGHAWVVTPNARIKNPAGVSDACLTAFLSAHSTVVDYHYPCLWYSALLQLFTGIQVAGPRLTPAAMSQGFHAIPPGPSGDPQVAACYYDPGDYTCVKDATAQWWDSQQPNSFNQNQPGCWRQPLQGKRYQAAGWPAGNVDGQKDITADPCNGVDGGKLILATQN